MVVVVDTVSATPQRPRHPEKVNRPDALSPPKPVWIRVRAPNTRGYADTRQIVKENGLVTVCEQAGCPNIGEGWDKKHATFMIMGDTGTRACAFCNVKTGKPGGLDPREPEPPPPRTRTPWRKPLSSSGSTISWSPRWTATISPMAAPTILRKPFGR